MTSLWRKSFRGVVQMAAAVLTFTLCWSALAAAQMPETDPVRSSAHLVEGGGHIVKSGFGLCWRTSDWTPALAGCECDGCAAGSAAAAPMPAPAPASAPPAPAPPAPTSFAEKITFAADVQFDSGKAVLRPEAKQKLAEFVRQASGFVLEVVAVVGHADQREGKQPAFRNLGQRRADAVKAFLVMSGMASNRVYVESKESSQPLTGKQCDALGPVQSRACLQADRRVELELTGTRQGELAKPSNLDKASCRSACQQISDDCWSASSARKTQCEKSGTTSRKVCNSRYQDDVSDCSFQRIQCARACD